MKNIKLLILLILTIILSCHSISYLDDEYSYDYNHLVGILGTGVFYSIFLLAISKKKRSILSVILTYLLLNLLWFFSLYGSMLSWGLLCPISGSISAGIIARYVIFEKIRPKEIINYMILGGLTVLAGFILFYIVPIPSNYFGSKMIGIIAFWQISIGVKTIKMISDN